MAKKKIGCLGTTLIIILVIVLIPGAAALIVANMTLEKPGFAGMALFNGQSLRDMGLDDTKIKASAERYAHRWIQCNRVLWFYLPPKKTARPTFAILPTAPFSCYIVRLPIRRYGTAAPFLRRILFRLRQGL